MSNFVSISRVKGPINQLSLVVDDISSMQLKMESATVVIVMRSGHEYSYPFSQVEEAIQFYAQLTREIESSGRVLSSLDVIDFDN